MRKQCFMKDFVWQAVLKDYNLLGFDAVQFGRGAY
jgi:hypothetical protein